MAKTTGPEQRSPDLAQDHARPLEEPRGPKVLPGGPVGRPVPRGHRSMMGEDPNHDHDEDEADPTQQRPAMGLPPRQDWHHPRGEGPEEIPTKHGPPSRGDIMLAEPCDQLPPHPYAHNRGAKDCSDRHQRPPNVCLTRLLYGLAQHCNPPLRLAQILPKPPDLP